LNMINFSLSGPAQWRGGIAQGPDNYILSKSLPVECGVNRVLIRSTTTAGKITLTAGSERLKPASVELISKPVKVTDGLSLEMPGEGLPSYLERGPTPQAKPLKLSRKPVRIANSVAGTNNDRAALSYDDNETTGWSNDGKLETGWIRYDFTEPATVNEVVMKLANWRRTSYSIQMFVDGKKVYQGDTPRSLGYVTLPVQPAIGKNLTVALQGVSKSEDSFNIVELSGKKDQATDANSSRGGDRNTLRIIEIEIYEN
jgi:beta-galactosidase